MFANFASEMLKIIRHIRFGIIPPVIVLMICMAAFMQFHHHDCQGNVRVSIVESCECHHCDDASEEHWPESSHHAHGCEEGCCNGSLSAIRLGGENVFDFHKYSQAPTIDVVAILAESSSGHSPLTFVECLSSIFYEDETVGVVSVHSLRGPPQID